jgi:hypothetical protein
LSSPIGILIITDMHAKEKMQLYRLPLQIVALVLLTTPFASAVPMLAKNQIAQTFALGLNPNAIQEPL